MLDVFGNFILIIEKFILQARPTLKVYGKFHRLKVFSLTNVISERLKFATYNIEGKDQVSIFVLANIL